MPKLKTPLLIERIQQRITDLEFGAAFEARDINALLTSEQQIALKALWLEQQALRKRHKLPKNKLEKQQLGWKTIRDVRIEVYKNALVKAKGSLLASVKDDQAAAELKRARVFMAAFADAGKVRRNARSAANIAVRRAGYQPLHASPQIGRKATQRDELIRDMELRLIGKEGDAEQ